MPENCHPSFQPAEGVALRKDFRDCSCSTSVQSSPRSSGCQTAFDKIEASERAGLCSDEVYLMIGRCARALPMRMQAQLLQQHDGLRTLLGRQAFGRSLHRRFVLLECLLDELASGFRQVDHTSPPVAGIVAAVDQSLRLQPVDRRRDRPAGQMTNPLARSRSQASDPCAAAPQARRNRRIRGPAHRSA